MKYTFHFALGVFGIGISLFTARPAHAVGESVNGFPNWAERVIHEWMNRARCDPQVEMNSCTGSNCGEKACYSPIAPLPYNYNLNRAARFHSDEMRLQSYFAHDSACAVVPNINSLYPTSCAGAANCACTGGTPTAWNSRVPLFGTGTSGEIIASGSDPNGAFYQWLYENSPGTTCAYSTANGHRWNILKQTSAVGTGVSGPSVGDFGGSGAAPKIPSGSHYPRQAATVNVWANWYDTAGGPQSALVDVDGACQPMTRMRGSAQNGAWTAAVTGVGTGCHRYFFLFTDSTGATVTYPTTGSLAIGPTTGCPDYDATRPPTGTGCGGLTLPEDGGTTPDPQDGGTGSGDGGSDPGTGPDPGGTTASGCGCRVGGSSDPGFALSGGLLLSLLALTQLRRRRAEVRIDR